MTETQTIFVPEEHFSDVPESFSGESSVTGVESRVNTNGIILDSIKEVELVLRVYNGEKNVVALSSIATTMDFVTNMYDVAGPMGAGLNALASEMMMKGKDFVGTMMAEAKGNIATKGKYRRNYDYDAIGSNFLKTSVTIRKVEDKFVLNISTAYIGNKSEVELAVLLGRRIALSSISIDVSMGVVDDWWYNLNPKEVLGNVLDFDDKGWEKFAESLANTDERICLTQEHDGEMINLIFSVDYSRYRFPTETEDDQHNSNNSKILTRAVGSNVAGAAWNAYRHEREEAKGEDIKLHLIVKFVSEGYNTPPITDPVKTELLTTAAKEIEEKLLEKVA